MVPSFSTWSQSPSTSPSKQRPQQQPSTSVQNQKDKPKKPRHRHAAFQLTALNELYDQNEHPSLEERTALAQRLGMEVKTVNAWFQNKRASSKKRHKGNSNQCELPPISALIASVSASTAPLPPVEFDELSEDDRPLALTDRNLSRISQSASNSRQQTSFYAGNPQHRHLFEAENAMPRKGRSRPSAAQTEELRKLYDSNPHPSKEEREELGDRIGMRFQSVTNWFQNQRSIAKKRKEEEDAQATSTREIEYDIHHEASSSSSRTYSPFPPSSSVVHPSLGVPPSTGHPSLPSFVHPSRARRSSSMAYGSSAMDSRPPSPRGSPYGSAAADRASSVNGSRPRRTRPEPYQLDALKKLFRRTATPSIEERGALALEVNMDVGKVTNWFRNLRQTARKRSKKGGDDDYDDDISLNDFSRSVSRAGSPTSSLSPSFRAQDQYDHDVLMDDQVELHMPPGVKLEAEEKNHRMYSLVPHSRSHSDMGSEEEYQEAVTPSESSPSPAFLSSMHAQKRAHPESHMHRNIALAVETLPYSEMEKASAKFQTGVRVEDALLLLSFHHHVVR